MANVWTWSSKAGIAVVLLGISLACAGPARAEDCPSPFREGAEKATQREQPAVMTQKAGAPACRADFFSEGMPDSACATHRAPLARKEGAAQWASAGAPRLSSLAGALADSY